MSSQSKRPSPTLSIQVDVDWQGAETHRPSEEEMATLQPLVVTAIQEAFRRQGVFSGRVDLVWTDEESIRRFNRQFRQMDRPTDVLSFPMDAVGIASGEPVAQDSSPEPPELGAVVISWPRMCEQAREYGHSREREACYLAVHSVLHLCGYDHETPAEKACMRRYEEETLDALGLGRDDRA
ncbi:MAG: rRNA maturation RNase YbeY [Limnochordaceae bacterium]|nr:rRNA maturation RNase YbeY [Limnochordaceae bacterium]